MEIEFEKACEIKEWEIKKEKMSRANEIPCVWYSKGMSFGGTVYPRQFFR
jgi:hypothetical protein